MEVKTAGAEAKYRGGVFLKNGFGFTKTPWWSFPKERIRICLKGNSRSYIFFKKTLIDLRIAKNV